MAGVPAHYIRDAPVDWKLEFLASAGGSCSGDTAGFVWRLGVA